MFLNDKGLGVKQNTLGSNKNLQTSIQSSDSNKAEVGARAFLAALPRGSCRLEPALFVSELRQRLGVPDAAEDTWCPLCNAVLDRYSHHAALCCAGGERNQRHHALRDLVYHWATRAGMQPEREKAGLLLPQRPEDTALARRRPADVYLPCLRGSPTALDLAVTAPQRLESLAQASQEATSSAGAYAQRKPTICKRLGCVPSKVFVSNPWLSSALGPGTRLRPRSCGKSPVRLQPARELTARLCMANSYKSLALPPDGFVPAPSCAAGPNLAFVLIQPLLQRACLRRPSADAMSAWVFPCLWGPGGRKWIQLQGETMAGWLLCSG